MAPKAQAAPQNEAIATPRLFRDSLPSVRYGYLTVMARKPLRITFCLSPIMSDL